MLRDLIVGLEDEEFRTGVPDLARASASQEEIALYEERGWDTMMMRRKTLEDGRSVLDPTPSELSDALQVIMGRLARANLTWRMKSSSKIPLVFENEDA